MPMPSSVFKIFLQILYVDSLIVDKVVIPSTTPRVAAWSKKLLDHVIKEDTKNDGSFGKLKACIKIVQYCFFLFSFFFWC